MVGQNLHLLYFQVVLFGNLSQKPGHRRFNFLGFKNVLTVLGTPSNMVPKFVSGVVGSLNTHRFGGLGSPYTTNGFCSSLPAAILPQCQALGLAAVLVKW